MAFRWLTLILGVTLFQNIFTFNPIPIPEDEEWAEFARTLNDDAYRLPTTTRPSRYRVSLTPYFDAAPSPFTFDGDVTVQLSATQADVREIVMHCLDLTIDTVRLTLNNNPVVLTNEKYECDEFQFLKLQLRDPLQIGQEYSVYMEFTGKLQTNMRGFYRSWYNDGGVRRWMATTQFQPGHARQAFPCYDEPGFKAYFDITIVRENSFRPTISNMPIKETLPAPNNRISETFFTTPLMSTYLIAFIVSHYEAISVGTKATRPFEIHARKSAGNTGDYALEVGERLLEVMEEFVQIPYYETAAEMNMKQAAIPDFSAGAMENWGLLTYREALILYDPRNTNHFYKQRIANIVSHEVTHMWFGNLVTCAWWDNLWLNEGFARFYQYYLTHSVEPEFGYDIRFIVEQLQQAMLSDSVDSAHALTNTGVSNPQSVSDNFSTITYARGACIIRMTQHFLGNDTFTKGLRKYLKDRSFDVAEPKHLFESLDAAAIEDRSLDGYVDITIDSYFRTWSEKAGHPILNVAINQNTGEMIVTQDRWERDTGVSKHPSLWEIPITWTRGGNPDFNSLKPSQVITGKTTSIKRGTLGLEWVIFNKQVSGFYKVNYDQTNWALITRALRDSERTAIHQLNRAQIVDDLFNFARAGIMRYNRVFNIISFLEFEDDYAPWISAITGFNFALGRLAADSVNLPKLQNETIRMSGAITERLGYMEIEGEEFMDGLLRMHVMTYLCNVGHPECMAAAKQNFSNWRNGGYIPANMRPWVYCSGLRQGTEDDFTYFWNRYKAEDLANEEVVMITAAGCTPHAASLETFLDATISEDELVRPQDFNSAWSSAVTGNPGNALLAFEWLKRNVQNIEKVFGADSAQSRTIVSNIASRMHSEQGMTQLSTWLEENRQVLGRAYNTGINGIATTRNNQAWGARRAGEFASYFDTGYVEDEISVGGGGGDGDAGGDGDGDGGGGGGGGDDGGAASIALSIVALIATVTVTFVV